MKIDTWLLWYDEILENFGFSREDDETCAHYLNDFLKNKGLKVTDLPSSDKFIVFGAGPSLKRHLKILKNSLSIEKWKEWVLISADGATTALMEENITPNIIVTDLDGKMEDILKANSQGSYLAVHAHGNNQENLKQYLPEIKNILGTTQSIPLQNVHNFGGFTDGDRAVFLAVELGAKNIIMAGMDFGTVVTKYSRPDMDQDTGPADDIKKMKLEYAEKLVKWVEHNTSVSIYNLIEIDNLREILDDL